ncbi:MAG: large-conductance mechanosensitive channel protein MscL [Methylococcaceae bacterium]
MSMLKEFKEFAVQGNAVEMAVGIIIGAAFGKVISSLVGDVIMPPIGVVLGGVNFADLAITLKEAIIATPAIEGAPAVAATPAVVLAYGKFIQSILDFTIVAFAMFMAIRGMNSLKRKPAEAPAAVEAPPAQEVLLKEIRDLLAKK